MELNGQLQPQKLQQAQALLHYYNNNETERKRIKKDYHKLLGSDCIIIF